VKAVATMVLGDDHVVFLDALAAVLTQHGHFVRAVAPGADELVESVRSTQPEVCLINRYLDVDDLADVIGRVIGASGGTRVIVLSGDADTVTAPQALDAGASGYVHKSRGVSALISAVERVLAGNVVVDVPAAANIRRSASPNDVERLAARLTMRERECLSLLVEGLDTAAMVVKLGISRTTVRTHVQAVLNKLGVHSRLEAASLAVRSGILDAGYEDIRARHRPAGGPALVEPGSGTPPRHGLPRGRPRMAAKPPAEHRTAAKPPAEHRTAAKPPAEHRTAAKPPAEHRMAAKPPVEHRKAFSAGLTPLPRARLAPPPQAPVPVTDRAG
jgi:two-component system, NarL family, nitrate/nitrite response regulator NarL